MFPQHCLLYIFLICFSTEDLSAMFNGSDFVFRFVLLLKTLTAMFCGSDCALLAAQDGSLIPFRRSCLLTQRYVQGSCGHSCCITLHLHGFQMPTYSVAGNYTMQVLGSTEDAGFLFQNDTKLEFQSKSVSMFIQTDKFLYNKRQWSE